MKLKNLVGLAFGRLTVVSLLPKTSKNRKWLCICSCGNSVEVFGHNLVNGTTASCGCLQRDRTSIANRTHGLSGTKFEQSYYDMMKRCYDEKNHAYLSYGGRGISVEQRWHTFSNFIEDMFPTYNEGLTLERKDPNRNYSLQNCTWVVKEKQARNKRKYRTNKSGISGTCSYRNSWVGFCRDLSGRARSKSFSIHLYGDELAKLCATEWRDKMLRLMAAHGKVYSEYHGK